MSGPGLFLYPFVDVSSLRLLVLSPRYDKKQTKTEKSSKKNLYKHRIIKNKHRIIEKNNNMITPKYIGAPHPHGSKLEAAAIENIHKGIDQQCGPTNSALQHFLGTIHQEHSSSSYFHGIQDVN